MPAGQGRKPRSGGAERASLDGMALVRHAWLQAGKACSSAHNPSPRFLPKLHSMPPSLRIRPEMCCPIRLSSTGCHGTRLNPSPPSPLKLSIIANRPLDSWVEPTSWPVTWLPGRFPQERGAAASCPHLVRAARFEHRGGSILVRRGIPKLLTRPRRRMASGSLRSGQCPFRVTRDTLTAHRSLPGLP